MLISQEITSGLRFAKQAGMKLVRSIIVVSLLSLPLLLLHAQAEELPKPREVFMNMLEKIGAIQSDDQRVTEILNKLRAQGEQRGTEPYLLDLLGRRHAEFVDGWVKKAYALTEMHDSQGNLVTDPNEHKRTLAAFRADYEAARKKYSKFTTKLSSPIETKVFEGTADDINALLKYETAISEKASK